MTQSCLFWKSHFWKVLLNFWNKLLKYQKNCTPTLYQLWLARKGSAWLPKKILVYWGQKFKLPLFPTHVLTLWAQIQLWEVWFRDPILKTWGPIILTKTLKNVNKDKIFVLSTDVECGFRLAYCIVTMY